MDQSRALLENKRAQYIGQRVCQALRIPIEKWELLLKDDDSRGHLQRFMADTKFINKNLMFCLSPKQLPICSPNSFTKGKKAVACYKQYKIAQPEDDAAFCKSLAFVDVPKNPIGFISKVTDNVYAPISKSDKNIEGYSKPVINDIVTTMSEISGNFYILSGKSQGLTVLTLPAKEILNAEDSPSKLHAYENYVVQWVEQTNNILNQEFPENENLTPQDEFKYWKKRKENLEILKEQIANPDVVQVIDTLREKSPPFATQFETVAAGVDEALDLSTETSNSLHPIYSYVDKLDATGGELDTLHESFVPCFHLLYLMYTKTRWYHSPRNICSLLRRLSDFYTKQFATAIDGTSIFGGDPVESMEHINDSIVQLNRFNQCYAQFKEKLLESEGNSFTLNNQAVMHNFLELLSRMEKIKPIVQTIIEFNRFDKTEVGGIHGHILSSKFQDLVKSFQDIESKFTGLEENLLEVNDDEFVTLITEIETDFNDLDVRAVAIAIWAIQDVSSIVSLGQILSGFNALLKRPFFISSFKSQYQYIVDLFSKDLEAIAYTYRTERVNPPILHGIPPTTSDFIWCNGLLQRLIALEDTLQNTVPEIFTDPAMIEANKKKNELMENIKNTMTEKISQWANSITDNYKDKLKNPLLIRDPNTRLLSMNFDPDLQRLLEEVKFLSTHMTKLPISAKHAPTTKPTYPVPATATFINYSTSPS